MSLGYLTLLCIGLAALWQAVDAQSAFTIDEVVLTLLPGKDVTSGTDVTLRCEAKVSHSLQQPLKYLFRFFQNEAVVYTKNSSESMVNRTLQSVRVFNSGHYKCDVRIFDKFRESESQPLAVTGLQTPSLKVKSDIVSEGENIIVTCSALEETGSLIFVFYENNHQIISVPSSSNSVTVNITQKNPKETYLQCAYRVMLLPDAGLSKKSNMWKIIVKDLNEITPKIKISPSTNVVEGDRVQVTCQVKDSSNLGVFLTKNGTLLHQFHTSFTHSFTVRAEDSGEYVCKAEKGNVQKMASDRLSVAELFSKPMLKLSPDQVFEGDSFRLTCTCALNFTQNFSKADISFYLLKEDQRISSAATYTGKASSATNGNYFCVAMAKGVKKTSLPLVFKAKVPVSVPIISAVGNVIVGQPFKVWCKAENGSLPITFRLLKDRSLVAEMKVMKTTDRAIFNITSISYPEEIQRFTCQANNKDSITKNSATLRTSVIEPVSKPFLQVISPTITEGTDLYLICSIQQGTEPITFRWYHNENEIPSSSLEVSLLQSTHIVKAIERDQKGRYHCEATNLASEIKRSPPVTITVSLAIWKKALIGVLCILLLVAIIIVLIVLLKKMPNSRKKKPATELSVKPRPKSGDPMRVSLTMDIEDNSAVNGTPYVMGRNVWSENVSASEGDDHSEEESELIHPPEGDCNREVPVTKEVDPEHKIHCTDVQVPTPGVLEQPEAVALEYAQLNNSEPEPA
ncbi:platelet endothelial cell adhesion molecule isoform X1 [Paramisgurnus dabryanus]|uniref:platelet endothelial cell adhesion molecule isoform X1 n=1 Tax=Paramisgurnus dabryanus TaxID=90735 RepID=UPI0031F41AA8